MSATDTLEILRSQISSPDTGWSLGTFGAIAEFTRDRDERTSLSANALPLSALTSRGGIRIERTDGVRLFASESLTRESWNHRVALCLPSEKCAMNARRVLTELGPDDDALKAQDRQSVLFDLGLAAPHVDLCIRVADDAVTDKLRSHCGRGVFEHGNPAMSLILAASPHRVFISRVGRLEVYQPIPGANGKSPDGPHTHVLPKLLHHQRTHAATEPVPNGWTPCAHLYPAHPAKDDHGRVRPFDPQRHDAFQRILDTFGDQELCALKRKIADAVVQGREPSSINVPGHRHAAASARIALRQLKASQTDLASLSAWLAIHDRHAETDTSDEDIHKS
jgi:hypothetical protein